METHGLYFSTGHLLSLETAKEAWGAGMETFKNQSEISVILEDVGDKVLSVWEIQYNFCILKLQGIGSSED